VLGRWPASSTRNLQFVPLTSWLLTNQDARAAAARPLDQGAPLPAAAHSRPTKWDRARAAAPATDRKQNQSKIQRIRARTGTPKRAPNCEYLFMLIRPGRPAAAAAAADDDDGDCRQCPRLRRPTTTQIDWDGRLAAKKGQRESTSAPLSCRRRRLPLSKSLVGNFSILSEYAQISQSNTLIGEPLLRGPANLMLIQALSALRARLPPPLRPRSTRNPPIRPPPTERE
jgi:hypothetical protein